MNAFELCASSPGKLPAGKYWIAACIRASEPDLASIHSVAYRIADQLDATIDDSGTQFLVGGAIDRWSGAVLECRLTRDTGEVWTCSLPLEDRSVSKELIKRSQVFVSYSRKDKEWLEKLQEMLDPLIRNQTIDLWDDGRIQPGQQWRQEIQTALGKARVAVLLVSRHFLASEFITANELPPILDAAKQQQMTILWVCLSDCMYENTPIERYQAAHDPSKPLVGMAPAKQIKTLKKICQRIAQAAK